MMESEEIPDFFKLDIDDLMTYEGAKRYYHEYPKMVQKPLSIKTLLRMLENGRIQNYTSFKLLFIDMIVNSRYVHILLNNSYMLECG